MKSKAWNHQLTHDSALENASLSIMIHVASFCSSLWDKLRVFCGHLMVKITLFCALGRLSALLLSKHTQQAKTRPQLSAPALQIGQRSYSTPVTCLQILLCINQWSALCTLIYELKEISEELIVFPIFHY